MGVSNEDLEVAIKKVGIGADAVQKAYACFCG
jgi:hypothetical protein